MIHVFLSWFEPFRVRVSMDLAGVREERREKRRKRNIAKNERKRVGDVLYKALEPGRF